MWRRKTEPTKATSALCPLWRKVLVIVPAKEKQWKQDIKGWAGEWAVWAKSFRSALPPIHNHPAGKYSRLTGRGREHCSTVTGDGHWLLMQVSLISRIQIAKQIYWILTMSCQARVVFPDKVSFKGKEWLYYEHWLSGFKHLNLIVKSKLWFTPKSILNNQFPWPFKLSDWLTNFHLCNLYANVHTVKKNPL